MNIENQAEIKDSGIRERNEVVVMNSKPILGIMEDGDLAEWFLIELLMRLPVKLIFRFKLVCKHWLSVISDPSFARIFISRASLLQPMQPWLLDSGHMVIDRPNLPKLIKFESVKNIYACELKSPSCLQLHISSKQQPQGRNLMVYGISNGLVLSAPVTIPDDVNVSTTTTYSICNPVTEQWITLPPLTCRFHYAQAGLLSEVEDGILKSYRVVSLDWSFHSKLMTKFSVFLSEIGEWMNFSLSRGVDIMHGRSSFNLNGNLHWVLRSGILAYDPYKEPDALRVIPSPGFQGQEFNVPEEQTTHSAYGVSKGKLRYVEVYGLLDGSSTLDVWVLNDYSSGDWCLQHRVGHFDIHFDASLLQQNFSIPPISFDPYDSDIMYLGYTNAYASFNIKTEKLETHGQPLNAREIDDPEAYVVSYWQWCCWYSGPIFFIPPWPTFIPPPLDLSRNDELSCLLQSSLRVD